MLSQKKGRRYGEGYQKALQISGRRLPLVRSQSAGGSERPARLQGQAQCLVYEYLFCLVVGRAFRFPHDGGAGRDVMVYLITKQLKWPVQRSSDDGGYVVGRATVV